MDIVFPRPRLALAGRRGPELSPVAERLLARCAVLPLHASEISENAWLDGEVDGVLSLSAADVPAAACARARASDLEDAGEAHRYLSLLFGLARLRDVRATGSRFDLVEFHAAHKYLLLAYSEREMRGLGRITAGAAERPWPETAALYRAGFVQAFSAPAARGAWVNALEHVYGHVADHLAAADRRHFFEGLEEVRSGGSVDGVLDLLRGWAARYDVPYVAAQTLLHPFPNLLLSPI